ncbi:LSU ribosomal protein L21p [hydrothermal vent metagenome]|uniref:LSU ribosomal protein L21p n=1 Tax=hydrothermal vent metagenome TaxID=652676 RepID=A0A3B0TA17_9ZZZZ
MDFSNMNIWCWLIPLLIGVISGILGYLIGKGSSTTIDNSADLKLWKDKNSKLQADLDACTNKLSAKAVAPVVAAIPFDADAAKAAFGKTIKHDDLKVVEGIGPKIEEMFHAGGIKTWKELSETAVARCQEILDGGGERYKVHDPASWPMQSKMCYENKWSELFKWQEEHDHGKL